ncbi:MAG: FecR domain-containing protein [Firmicutes bacterium]|nr:FecR domain-containing protein [Bacillota bacterium]
MRRKTRAVFWTFLFCLTAAVISPAEEPVGRVEWVKGRLNLTRAGRQHLARAGESLYEGDRLVTGRLSRALLVLGGHRLEMGPASTLLLVAVRPPTRYRFFLWLGRLRLAVTELLGLDLRVETPAAIAGVRGTVFRVAVAADGTTVIGVEEGTVVVTTPAGEGEVALHAGHEVTVRPGAPPMMPRKTTGGPGEEGDPQMGKEKETPKGEEQGQGPQGGGGK